MAIGSVPAGIRRDNRSGVLRGLQRPVSGGYRPDSDLLTVVSLDDLQAGWSHLGLPAIRGDMD